MFERLTWRDEHGVAHAPVGIPCYVDIKGVSADHLAAYEDSGLSPEEVQELTKAKADGRLVVLPCKARDPIYWFWTDGEGNPEGDIEEELVLYFYIDKDGVGIATKFYDGHIGHYEKDGELVDGVRRIYLTREAAEKAIAEVAGK